MKDPILAKAIKASAAPKRAKHFLDLLLATSAGRRLQKASVEQARILAALLSGSEALSTLLAANPDWLDSLTPESLNAPRRKQGLQAAASACLKGDSDAP